MRPVNRQLGHTAVTLQADVVPNAVIDGQASNSHQSFATSAVETILNLENYVISKSVIVKYIFYNIYFSVDDLQNAIVDSAGCKHEATSRMNGAEAKSQQEMAFDGRAETVLGVGFASEEERMTGLIASGHRVFARSDLCQFIDASRMVLGTTTRIARRALLGPADA